MFLVYCSLNKPLELLSRYRWVLNVLTSSLPGIFFILSEVAYVTFTRGEKKKKKKINSYRPHNRFISGSLGHCHCL